MPLPLPRFAIWALLWTAISAIGAVVLARAELSQLRDAFDTDARIVHRLLSQRVVQHDALLSSLALLQPPAGGERRLSSVYPQIIEVLRREASAEWPNPAMIQAEGRSRTQQRAELAHLDFSTGRYLLLSAANPSSFALLLDLRSVVPWNEWPMNPQTSPVRVSLEHLDQQYVIQQGQQGQPQAEGWRFEAQKTLASASQPFNVVAVQQIGWSQLPWLVMCAWLVLVGATLAALYALLRQREQQRRAEELLRFGQVARLNQMGELAAGLAHELNQPLTAVLANTQAAQRLLAEEPAEIDTARGAMVQAVTQARRASDVISRLRRSIDPSSSTPLQVVNLADAAQAALDLLIPQLQTHHVQTTVQAQNMTLVQANPVALEQIIYNLITNAIQSMEQVPASRRQLIITVQTEGTKGTLSVSDSGRGIPIEAIPRLFEPFFSTREGGLGLGLSLCESLAEKMNGQISARNLANSGASFTISLPLAQGKQP
jgi:signal transduction histidine kinase